ncbi:MAG: Crp/Fnr family transcriptional regulator [Gammaproteobacteria bacterium]|nr:Crp/Fnr family transcriptional regulator [Gammaproteobacteria bacterium]
MQKNETKTISNILKHNALFQNLSSIQLEQLGNSCKILNLDKQQLIFSEGEAANNIYILIHGSVKAFKISDEGKEQIVKIFNNGDIFGEAAMFAGDTYPVNSSTLSDSSIISLAKKDLLKLIKLDPDIAMHMLAIQAKKLRILTKTIENLTLYDSEKRLMDYLKQLAVDAGKDTITLNISKTNLAMLIGTSRENLSRIMQKLAKKKFISFNEKEITIM